VLYQIGALTLDTRPFNADEMKRSSAADFATKPTIGGLQGREFMGEGEDKLTLSGQLLPTKTGGMSELESAHSFRRAGTRLPVVRGDGKSFGWFVITSISESHTDLMRDGVGFVVKFDIDLAKVDAPSAGSAGNLIQTLLSLFGALGR